MTLLTQFAQNGIAPSINDFGGMPPGPRAYYAAFLRRRLGGSGSMGVRIATIGQGRAAQPAGSFTSA